MFFTITALVFLALGVSPTFGKNADAPSDDLLTLLGGSIPFPPEKMIQILQAKGIQVDAAIIPNGRSLERKYTSYQEPRTVLGFKIPIPNEPGKTRAVFMGYTPGNKNLQIIFETAEHKPAQFQTIENYSSERSAYKLSPPPQTGLCLACHRSAVPLFPEEIWTETDFNPAIDAKLRAQAKLDPFARYILERKDKTVHKSGAEDLSDLSTEMALRILPTPSDWTKNLCLHGCGSSIECRKFLVLASLAAGSSHSGQDWNLIPELYSSYDFPKLEDEISRFGQPQSILMLGSQLQDRTSMGHEKEIQSGPGNDPLYPVYNSPPEARVIFEQRTPGFNTKPSPLPGSTPGGPPSLADNLLTTVQQTAPACFSFDPEEKAFLRSTSLESKIKLVNSQSFLSLMGSKWPLDSKQIISTLKQEASSSSELNSPCLQGQSTSPISARNHSLISTGLKISQSVPAKQKASTLFLVYCASCHYGSSSPAPTLDLEHMDKLKTYVGTAGRTVKALLSYNPALMPPPGVAAPSYEERQSMIELMENR